jgi:hypothetical protein
VRAPRLDDAAHDGPACSQIGCELFNCPAAPSRPSEAAENRLARKIYVFILVRIYRAAYDLFEKLRYGNLSRVRHAVIFLHA